MPATGTENQQITEAYSKALDDAIKAGKDMSWKGGQEDGRASS
jgi:hypothetical protein